MSNNRVNVTSPVGRIVMGSLYNPNTTDAEGKPLVIKNGPNAGQPRSNYFFALAIPKGTERHWAETPWGQQILAVGARAFPQAYQSPAFAWKIEDGDSATPNKKGRKPCENEGWPGNWILKLSGGFAPKVYRQEGSGYVQITEVDYVKPGYFVEVAFNVDGNDSQSQPGVYINHSMVCFRAYGPEIVFGPNVEDAGFGKSALPAGASLTPVASTIAMPAAPSVPAVPTMPAVPVPVGVPSVPPGAVTPNPQFLQVPAPGSPVTLPNAPIAAPIPAVPAAPIASPSSVRRMTDKAGSTSYEAFLAAGWNDAQMIAQGYMLP